MQKFSLSNKLFSVQFLVLYKDTKEKHEVVVSHHLFIFRVPPEAVEYASPRLPELSHLKMECKDLLKYLSSSGGTFDNLLQVIITKLTESPNQQTHCFLINAAQIVSWGRPKSDAMWTKCQIATAYEFRNLSTKLCQSKYGYHFL